MTTADSEGIAVLEEFRRRLHEGEVTDDLRIEFGASGGPPGKRLARKVSIDKQGRAAAQTRDDLHDPRKRERLITLSSEETRAIFDEVSLAARDLRSRSRHQLVPDSFVGRILVETHGRQATFRFRVNARGDVLRQEELASAHLDRLMERLAMITPGPEEEAL